MEIKFNPIGLIKTPYQTTAPFQSSCNLNGNFKLILFPRYQQALKGLNTFKYIYVIYYLNRVKKENYHNLVIPPWGQNREKIGLFASRSPNRPNPIGLSVVEIKKIVDNKIIISGIDALNNTPLLDIKPYIQELDNKIEANFGWLDDAGGKEHLKLHLKGIPH